MNNKPSKKPLPARTICARIIARWLDTGDFPEKMIPGTIPERALIQEMVYGICRWKALLEAVINRLAKNEPDTITKAYLLTGLYQILRMDNIPPHAAANETVQAAKHDLPRGQVNFINAIIRKTLRDKPQILKWLQEQPLAIRSSHPEELVNRWISEYGRTTAQAICDWNNSRPDVTLRVNTALTTLDDYRQALYDAGIETTPHPADSRRFLVLPHGISIPSLPGYRDGLFSIQDPATMLAVDLLKLTPNGLKLLDACASPGGKTFACAEQMENTGTIIALDVHEDRLQILRRNAQRLNKSCVKIHRADASRKSTLTKIEDLGPFDRILLDVPCSNTGVLRRRPDARWRFSAKRLRRLVGVQARILNACSRLLAPGGILVYSTCSLEPEENENQIDRWLSLHPRFRLLEQTASIPPDSGMDGAFCAAITTK